MLLNFLRGLFTPRMIVWALLSVVLGAAALGVQALWPTSLVAVTLYKAHLMSLGGWGGYWLDRVLFPYGRPHECLGGECSIPINLAEPEGGPHDTPHEGLGFAGHYEAATLRRAIVVAACLICVGLGA
ncbi:MAG: putative holin [Comamonas sp.]